MGTTQPASIETVPKSSVDLAVLSKRVGSAGPEMKEREKGREKRKRDQLEVLFAWGVRCEFSTLLLLPHLADKHQ